MAIAGTSAALPGRCTGISGCSAKPIAAPSRQLGALSAPRRPSLARSPAPARALFSDSASGRPAAGVALGLGSSHRCLFLDGSRRRGVSAASPLRGCGGPRSPPRALPSARALPLGPCPRSSAGLRGASAAACALPAWATGVLVAASALPPLAAVGGVPSGGARAPRPRRGPPAAPPSARSFLSALLARFASPSSRRGLLRRWRQLPAAALVAAALFLLATLAVSYARVLRRRRAESPAAQRALRRSRADRNRFAIRAISSALQRARAQQGSAIRAGGAGEGQGRGEGQGQGQGQGQGRGEGEAAGLSLGYPLVDLGRSFAFLLRLRSGFSSAELFRKFVWYGLQARRLDAEFVSDVASLRRALGVTDDQAALALLTCAERVRARYGTVPLLRGGAALSAVGLQAKASARALAAKIVFLAEEPAVLGARVLPDGTGPADEALARADDLDDGAAAAARFAPAAAPGDVPTLDLGAVFGASYSELQALRIKSPEDHRTGGFLLNAFDGQAGADEHAASEEE